MNEIRYYYANEQNQPVGPFTLTDLRKMASTGVLEPNTQTCPEGGADWVPLASLLPDSTSRPPTSAPPARAKSEESSTATPEVKSGATGAASVIFPSLAILITIAIAANPVIFAMARSLGTGFLLFALPFAIGLFGPINAFKLLKVPGIFQQKPKAAIIAWIGIALFVLSLVLLLLVGFALEAEMARRVG